MTLANILDKIIADKHREVDEHKSQIPLETLQQQVSSLPKCRNFYKALTKPHPRGLNVIAEVKKASPSAGVIRQNFNPVEIALTYQTCGADAISVLTDEKYFQGKLEYLTQIKEAVRLLRSLIVSPLSCRILRIRSPGDSFASFACFMPVRSVRRS